MFDETVSIVRNFLIFRNIPFGQLVLFDRLNISKFSLRLIPHIGKKSITRSSIIESALESEKNGKSGFSVTSWKKRITIIHEIATCATGRIVYQKKT